MNTFIDTFIIHIIRELLLYWRPFLIDFIFLIHAFIIDIIVDNAVIARKLMWI